MIVDNFDLIRPLLKFRSEDDFYHIALIQRKKDCSWLGSNSRVVKDYYISSVEYFDKIKQEVMDICDATNARASIRLNRRSYRKVALHSLKVLTDKILNQSYVTAKSAYSTASGQYSNETDKVWILDIDIKDELEVQRVDSLVREISQHEEPIIRVIPTVNGFHLLTRPFNTKEFSDKEGNVDIHKDNPTLLYFKQK